MKSRLTAVLLAFLLCGCTARTEPPVVESPPPEVPAQEIPETPKEPAPTLPQQAPTAMDKMTMDGNIATIQLGGEQSYDAVFLQGINGAGEFTISIDNNIIYKQETESAERWCYLGAQSSDTLTITLPEDCTIDESFRLSEPSKSAETCVSAYLPYTSFTDQMLTNGLLESVDELTVNVGCYWKADGTLDVKAALPDMLTKLHAAYPELKIFCTINPKNGAAGAIYTAEQRQVLISSMLDFCETYQLAGVDIDWEFPAENEWDEFSALIVELSEALSSADRRLSLAFYPEAVKLTDEAVKAIHKAHMMAYDQFDEQGRHSTYQGAVEAIDYFLDLGFEAEQLSLGIPAYGRPLSGEALWPLYSEYADALADGSNLIGDSYFNSPQLAQDKALLAREEGLQGVFLYHLGCDVSDERSLTKALAAVLK